MDKTDSQKKIENLMKYKETEKSADKITVNAGQLADVLGVSDRRIRQLAEEGILVKAARGRYLLLESLKNYIILVKTAAESKECQTQERIDLNNEKAIHERVKRQISERRLKVMDGSLHKSEDVQRVMMDIFMNIRTKLLAVPAKTAPMLTNRNDAGYIQELLAGEVVEVLKELKEYDPKEFYSEDYMEVGEEDDSEG